jgi:hypothetical protein
MAKFQIVDMFHRNADATGDQPVEMVADSINNEGDGIVVFYKGGVKIATIALATGFIIQKMDG